MSERRRGGNSGFQRPRHWRQRKLTSCQVDERLLALCARAQALRERAGLRSAVSGGDGGRAGAGGVCGDSFKGQRGVGVFSSVEPPS